MREGQGAVGTSRLHVGIPKIDLCMDGVQLVLFLDQTKYLFFFFSSSLFFLSSVELDTSKHQMEEISKTNLITQ
jgi:hypothetical protein